MTLPIFRFLSRIFMLAVLGIFAATGLVGQDASVHVGPFVGKWLTSSKQGVVEIYDCGGTLCGRVIGLRQNRDENGARGRDGYNHDPAARNPPVSGSTVARHLRWDEPPATCAGSAKHAEAGKGTE